MLYEHVTDGKVDERVRPVVGSLNAAQLAVKALDPKSGWRAADEAASAPAPAPSKPAKGEDATPKGVMS